MSDHTPCPFCGSDDLTLEITGLMAVVVCRNCSAQGPRVHASTTEDDPIMFSRRDLAAMEDDAWARWNDQAWEPHDFAYTPARARAILEHLHSGNKNFAIAMLLADLSLSKDDVDRELGDQT